MAKQYEPSPVQLCLSLGDPPRYPTLDMETYSRVPLEIDHTDICKFTPLRMGQDQYRCNECGLVWDVDEPRPACKDTATED